MGYVTDGGLEPEPDASIKRLAPLVNRATVLKSGDLGRILGDLAVLAAADGSSGGMAGDATVRSGGVSSPGRPAAVGVPFGWFGRRAGFAR